MVKKSKVVFKIIAVMLIQAVVGVNIAWADMYVDVNKHSSILSPQLAVNEHQIQNIFSLLQDSKLILGILDSKHEPELMLGDRIYNLGIINHNINSKIGILNINLEFIINKYRNHMDEQELNKIINMKKYLFTGCMMMMGIVNNIHNITKKDISDLLSNISNAWTAYHELEKIKGGKNAADLTEYKIISGDNAEIIQDIPECIGLMQEFVEVITKGVEEKEFDLGQLLKQVTGKEAVKLKLFGYENGLRDVIESVALNISDHSGMDMLEYSQEVREEKGNIILEFSDKGKGFIIEELKEQAIGIKKYLEIQENLRGKAEPGRLKEMTEDQILSASEADTIELIFEKGFSSRYEEDKMRGLGLWLCRKIIEKYFNGTIRAENRRDAQGNILGAKFIIKLPANKLPDYALENPTKLFEFLRPTIEEIAGWELNGLMEAYIYAQAGKIKKMYEAVQKISPASYKLKSYLEQAEHKLRKKKTTELFEHIFHYVKNYISIATLISALNANRYDRLKPYLEILVQSDSSANTLLRVYKMNKNFFEPELLSRDQRKRIDAMARKQSKEKFVLALNVVKEKMGKDFLPQNSMIVLDIENARFIGQAI